MMHANSTPPPSGSAPMAHPANPLVRRSTLVRKRDENEKRLPLSPGKKPRVTFNADVEVQIVPDLLDTPGLVQDEVRQAFEKRKWGDTGDYDRIKKIYNPRDEEEREPVQTIRKYTMALLSNVAQLNKDTADLVGVILRSKWLGMPDDYVSIYVQLLAGILCGQGSFMGETLRMLVQNLTLTPNSNDTISEFPLVSRSTCYSRVHRTIRYLLQILPSANRVLSTVVTSQFPYHTESARAHGTYVKNLLRMTEYAPQFQSHILNLVTDRLVKIDVQVQVDLEDLTDEVGERVVDKIPQLRSGLVDDIDDDDASGLESDDDDEEQSDEVRRSKDFARDVEKMDLMLDILFNYYDKAPSTDALIDILLSQFTTIILPAHRSRHTQFLLFHFVQQSTTYIDTFVGSCVQTIFDRKQPALIRQASAAYLASFIARGIHVSSNIVQDVFDYIGGELSKLRREHEPTCKGPVLRRYAIYYSLVQALLYIFCFRWRDLEVRGGVDQDGDERTIAPYGQMHRWRPGVKEALSGNIFSKLNPLKVCSPAIVTEFARISNHLSIVYVYHLLETNKRIRLSHISGSQTAPFTHGQPDRETALSVSGNESALHLDEYFPFDPYQLPGSKRWIENDYREWSGVPGLDDQGATESDSDDDDEAHQSDVEEGTETDQTGRSL